MIECGKGTGEDLGQVNRDSCCSSCGVIVRVVIVKDFMPLCLFCFARMLDNELHLLRDRATTECLPKSHFQVLALN
jgi:hypothetical protein